MNTDYQVFESWSGLWILMRESTSANPILFGLYVDWKDQMNVQVFTSFYRVQLNLLIVFIGYNILESEALPVGSTPYSIGYVLLLVMGLAPFYFPPLLSCLRLFGLRWRLIHSVPRMSCSVPLHLRYRLLAFLSLSWSGLIRLPTRLPLRC